MNRNRQMLAIGSTERKPPWYSQDSPRPEARCGKISATWLTRHQLQMAIQDGPYASAN